jgi:hypothetical protein
MALQKVFNDIFRQPTEIKVVLEVMAVIQERIQVVDEGTFG